MERQASMFHSIEAQGQDVIKRANASADKRILVSATRKNRVLC